MKDKELQISLDATTLHVKFTGSFNLHKISAVTKRMDEYDISSVREVYFDLDNVEFIDTAFALFIQKTKREFENKQIITHISSVQKEIQDTLYLVVKQIDTPTKTTLESNENILEILGKFSYKAFQSILVFFNFLGKVFSTKIFYLRSYKNIRFKEIAFEINESGVKALPIIALTSFLIGLVVAYQSAYQLKMYGANIFLVDMLGISILRELAPLITAIVIAGRSGSAFTAQIGAMKITEELDAMRTMGFDPYVFLVMPRIIALIITMSILIFVADIMGILGGMIVANIDLAITPTLFLDRFLEAVDIKHFFVGIIKAPFFAFLIATIAIYRGLMVKDDTQSIGFNTTKSVVEAIFAVIVCDALFSIAFTNLGI
jgi:phospholipid/cholesterol/gamma-HCH transport system permease protein